MDGAHARGEAKLVDFGLAAMDETLNDEVLADQPGHAVGGSRQPLDDGRLYYVMEVLKGRELADVMKDNPAMTPTERR